MPEETKELLADVVAKSLEETVPSAVEAAIDVKLKELLLWDNPDIKEIKSQMRELVEKSRMSPWENLATVQDEFCKSFKSIKRLRHQCNKSNANTNRTRLMISCSSRIRKMSV